MPGQDERRDRPRVSLPVQMWFNILKSEQDYIRGDMSPLAELENLSDLPSLEGRDDLERFLVRIDHKLDLVLTLLADKIGRKDYRQKGSVNDISENGISMTSSMDIPAETALEIGIILPRPPYRTLDISGRVIWKGAETRPGDPRRLFSYGIKFTDILPQDQDEIVHWVFQKQREEIRKAKEDASFA